jgi:hypothetical protein
MQHEQFYTNKATIQFLYPFRVDRWETFRHGITGFLNEQEYDLQSSLLAAQDRLESAFGTEAPPVRKAKEILDRCISGTSRNPNRRRSNQSLAGEVRALVRELPATSDEFREVGQDLLYLELSELIREHEAKAPENMMKFVSKKINESRVPLLTQAKYHSGHSKGTRGYLERKQPYIETRFKAASLAIENPSILPDISAKLPSSSEFRDVPGIRIASTIRLLATGFGCVRLGVRLANEQGLKELVDEIIFTTMELKSAAIPSPADKTTKLAQELREAILDAVKKRSMVGIDTLLEKYPASLETKDLIRNRLRTAVDQVTLINGELTVDDIVDIENLDRGFSREHMPRLLWKESRDSASSMFEYFQHITRDVFLAELSQALLQDEDIVRFVNRPERRKRPERSEIILKEQLMSTIPNLTFPSLSPSIEEHPYVSTLLSAPSPFKNSASTPDQVVEHFSNTFARYKKDLVRVLMKSKWVVIRSDWEPAIRSLENVFYSDLVHMAVHIRSALCVYYAPGNANEVRLVPEMANVYKYLDELSDTIQWQRILWYAYATSDHLVTHDIRSISAALEVLKEKSLEEEFSEVIEGLADVTRGIDHRKIALAETIEDPLSRKGGSSLFFDLIEKTNHVFHLESLYRNLLHKVERLDMLGMHVSQNVQQYSSLLVQEGSRSAQFTLEFLEALIIGVYGAELVHLGMSEPRPFPFENWWIFYAITVGGFLTALPFISLIRKGRAKITVKDPKWAERADQFGVIVGPAILLTIAYLTNVSSVQFRLAPFVGFAGFYLILVGSWFQMSEKIFDRFLSKIKDKS